MLKLIAFVLLAFSLSGDAVILRRTQRLQNGLWEHENDGSFKAAYEKAVMEFPEFKYNAQESQTLDSYDKDDIYITLYSKSSPHGHKIDVDLVETIRNSSYDVKKVTKIIVGPTHMEALNTSELVTAYLRHQNEYVNVITVNYKKFFGVEFSRYVRIHDYLTETIAKLVEHLHRYGTLLDNVHMIGFGMSAHVVAGAAKLLNPYQIGRITGLDPTGGMFDQSQWLGGLMAEDADFVDVILTNTRKYGTKKERGSVLFYPNGGEVQPESDDLTSHLKALAYFIESIASTHSFQSEDANSWTDYKAGQTLGHTTYMGEYVSRRAINKFYLYVNPTSPYSKVGKYDLTLKDQVTYPQSWVFEAAQNALKKESTLLEDNLSQGVVAYNAEEARTEKPSARRIYDYVRRTSSGQMTETESY